MCSSGCSVMRTGLATLVEYSSAFNLPKNWLFFSPGIASLDADFRGVELPEDVDIEQLSNLLQLRQAVEALEREKWQLSLKFKYVSPFLQPGRLLRVSDCTFVLMVIDLSFPFNILNPFVPLLCGFL